MKFFRSAARPASRYRLAPGSPRPPGEGLGPARPSCPALSHSPLPPLIIDGQSHQAGPEGLVPVARVFDSAALLRALSGKRTRALFFMFPPPFYSAGTRKFHALARPLLRFSEEAGGVEPKPQPSPARPIPSPARPGPARPSPVQPSPAQQGKCGDTTGGRL